MTIQVSLETGKMSMIVKLIICFLRIVACNCPIWMVLHLFIVLLKNFMKTCIFRNGWLTKKLFAPHYWNSNRWYYLATLCNICSLNLNLCFCPRMKTIVKMACLRNFKRCRPPDWRWWFCVLSHLISKVSGMIISSI